ncbi:MAG: hypothetical protein IJ752_02695 [Alphaproteobacteria bacterium]|nr:hypothetical protein [Alphaproteobacteria bacterium]
MLNMDFTVDLSVWQDGVTFRSDPIPTVTSETPRIFSFAQQLNTVGASASEQSSVIRKEPAAVPAILAAQEQKVQEMPAALADVVDLTPFIVSADTTGKPGARLNEQLERTTFSKKQNTFAGKESPYNLSEEKAKAREVRQATKNLKGPGDAKVFPMNTVARFRDNQTKYGIAQPLTANAADQAKQLRIEEMKQQAKAKTINETNTTLAQKPVSSIKPSAVDTEAIRAQVSSNEGFGYPRPNLPNTSSEKVSPAASWFPEAMTRQLDAYEAAKKAAQYGAVGTVQKNVTDTTI